MPQMNEPPVALVSEVARDLLASRIGKDPTPLRWAISRPDAALAPELLAQVSVAFMSLDLVSGSATDKLAPELSHFFEQLRACAKLRWLHVCSAGADRPIFKELLARGVRITTSSGANAAEVSHSALAGFLALSRGVVRWVDAQRRHEWSPLKGTLAPRDIEGQTAVVVGLGPIGREIARLLDAFRVEVIGVRRTSEPVACCAEVVPYARLDAVLPRADWLILACPLTRETQGLIGARQLELLRKGAHLINVARGPVVREPDLIEALRSGRLGGAYLDVFEKEPLPAESPLWDLPGVLISAHCAGYSGGLHLRTQERFLENLHRWMQGAELQNEVAAPSP